LRFVDGSTFATAVSAVADDASLLQFLVPCEQSFDEGITAFSLAICHIPSSS